VKLGKAPAWDFVTDNLLLEIEKTKTRERFNYLTGQINNCLYYREITVRTASAGMAII
jgi:hypothetical protein